MINVAFYKKLSEIIEKETGIRYTEDDYDRLGFRVTKLKELLKVNTDEELLKLLLSSPGADIQSLLVSTSTNNETSFFRDKKPFEVFINHIIPELLKDRTSKQFKIWSVAASTGQEPYSLAMKIKETSILNDFQVELKASDIDKEVLRKCKDGIYHQAEIQRGLPIQYLMKYFDQIDLNTWTVKKEIKAMINFVHFNLLNQSYPVDEYDIIFCRNVLIYQSLENKTIVINNLYKSLKSKGFLVLGGAENLIGIKSDFKSIAVDDIAIYYKG
jgi:chemotaxis protein methyltransferase CheR